MIGRTLGQFLVLEQIGAGGMGVVYKARDESLDRDVVLKVLPPGALADETARKRFRAEALALSRLNHPNICTIYQVGEADGQTYIAMEYVQGRQLNELIREGLISIDAVARYGGQIAEALAHAHERGLTHRDMKSGNVMITPEGRAKVLDFGLAVPSASADSESTRTQLTETGAVVGTPAYMPPEVVRGEPADARSDLWGLGIILYEMAVGSRPFKETAHALTYAILERPPQLPESVPPALRSIILRCLAKQPGERYQASGEVRAALGAVETQSQAGGPLVPAQNRRRRLTQVGVGVAAVGLLVLLAYGVNGLRGPFATVAEAQPIRSLAVLPFTSFSSDPDQEWFVDGMTDWLIGELGKLEGVTVMESTTMMTYKGSGMTAQEIASELEVDAIVEGSALSSGGRVRLRASLIHAESNENLWRDDYVLDMRDILSVLSETARTIAREIQAVLTPEAEARLADTDPVDPAVYTLTLQGKFYAKQLSQEALWEAIDYFDDALGRDSLYAPAHAGRAFAYAMLASFEYLPPHQAMPEVKRAARRAIQLDNGLSEAHAWLGFAQMFYDWNWAAAEQELLIALDLNPNSVDAHLAYTGYLTTQGQMDAAIRQVRRAQEIDPKSVAVYASGTGSQSTLYFARRFDESIEEGRIAVYLWPESAEAHSMLGLSLLLNGLTAEGVTELEQSTRLNEDAALLKAFLAYGYAEAGRESEARALLSDVEEIWRQSYTCAYEIALTHLALGDQDAVFDWLDKALEDHSMCVPYMNIDPRWDTLRDDPRFRELLDRVGFD